MNINEKELKSYRKYHYIRGFAIGAGITFIVMGGAFVVFCHALLAIMQ